MRDKKRIKKILSKLEKLWMLHEDMRFGQLLINYIFSDERLSWNKEDDDFEKEIDNAIEFHSVKKKDLDSHDGDDDLFKVDYNSRKKRKKDIFDRIDESDVLY